jgi:hypothetical protein
MAAQAGSGKQKNKIEYRRWGLAIKRGDKVFICDHSQTVTLCGDGTLKHKSACGGYYKNDELVVVSLECSFPTYAYITGDTESYAYDGKNDALCFSKTKKEFFFVHKEYLVPVYVCPLCGHGK